jgi:uncharacterized membrane protein
MNWFSLSSEDWIAAALSGALFSGYHVLLRYKSARNPDYSIQSLSARVRTQWVAAVMQQSKDILAVQTLRNSTMAATLMASTSVVLVLALLNILLQSHTLAADSRAKLFCALLALFVAFFQFAMAIRLYNHVGYMLGLPMNTELMNTEPSALSASRIVVYLNRGASHFSLGLRAYYAFVPLVVWFFGAWPFVIATAGVVLVMFLIDRSPIDATR